MLPGKVCGPVIQAGRRAAAKGTCVSYGTFLRSGLLRDCFEMGWAGARLVLGSAAWGHLGYVIVEENDNAFQTGFKKARVFPGKEN